MSFKEDLIFNVILIYQTREIAYLYFLCKFVIHMLNFKSNFNRKSSTTILEYSFKQSPSRRLQFKLFCITDY